MPSAFRTTVFVTFLVAAPAGFAAEAPDAPGDQPEMFAELFEWDTERNVVVAIGDVMITKGPTVLYADSLVAWPKDQQAYVEGNVRLIRGTSLFCAEKAYINWATERGIVFDARLKVSDRTAVLIQLRGIFGEKEIEEVIWGGEDPPDPEQKSYTTYSLVTFVGALISF